MKKTDIKNTESPEEIDFDQIPESKMSGGLRKLTGLKANDSKTKEKPKDAEEVREAKEAKQPDVIEEEPPLDQIKNPNVRKLRESRDSLRSENEELKKKLEALNGSESLEPLKKFLQEKYEGPVTEKAVSEFLEDYKSKDAGVSELQAAIEKKEQAIKELSILESDEWKNGYERPLNESKRNLLATLANVADDGSIRNEAVIGAISADLANLASNLEEVDPIEVKGYLAKISKAYKDQTGEDYDAPTVGSLTASIRDVMEKKAAQDEAFSSWSEAKSKAKEEGSIHDQKAKLERDAALKASRVEEAQKALDSFEVPEYWEVEDVERVFTEVHRDNEKIYSGESSAPYSSVLEMGVKARMYDDLEAKYLELQNELNSIRGVRGSGLSRSGGVSRSFSSGSTQNASSSRIKSLVR